MRLLVTNPPRHQRTRWSAKVGADALKEFVLMTEKTVKNVSLSKSGCESHDDGLVIIDSGASVNAGPQWFGESALENPDGSVRLRGADGRTLQDHRKRHIWLRIGNHLKRYEIHVVDATKPILSVRYLCDNGIGNTPCEATLLAAWRKTRAFDSERWCVLRQGADRS